MAAEVWHTSQKIFLCISVFIKPLCQTANCEGHFTCMALLEYISQAV